MNKKPYILILLSLILVPAAFAMAFDHSQFDQILKAYVDDQGLVDYNAIARDPERARHSEGRNGDSSKQHRGHEAYYEFGGESHDGARRWWRKRLGSRFHGYGSQRSGSGLSSCSSRASSRLAF